MSGPFNGSHLLITPARHGWDKQIESLPFFKIKSKYWFTLNQ